MGKVKVSPLMKWFFDRYTTSQITKLSAIGRAGIIPSKPNFYINFKRTKKERQNDRLDGMYSDRTGEIILQSK